MLVGFMADIPFIVLAALSVHSMIMVVAAQGAGLSMILLAISRCLSLSVRM